MKLIKIEESRTAPTHNNYCACPDCGYPLAPSNITITEGFFRNTATDCARVLADNKAKGKRYWEYSEEEMNKFIEKAKKRFEIKVFVEQECV